MRARELLVLFFVTASQTTIAAPASAEWFIDAYVGPAFTQSEAFDHGPNLPAHTHYNAVVSGGGRAGYYFDFWPYLGLAIDASHYQPEGKFSGGGSGFRFDARVTGLSLDAMLRLPLFTSKNFPKGQLQPYLTVGPGVYFSHLKIHPTPIFGSADSDTSAGVKVGTGISWMFAQNIGLLAEYRFSHFSANFLGFDTDVNTHRLQFGGTFRF